RILEDLADFVCDPEQRMLTRQRRRGASLATLEPVEYLLERDLHALVRAPVRARDQRAADRQAHAGDEHEGLRERQGRSDEGSGTRHAPSKDRQQAPAGNPIRLLLEAVVLERLETDPDFTR